MQAVYRDIEMAARSDAKVLITGETGVGKEAVAHTIHGRSRRNTAPIVALNCAGMPDSLLESEFFGHTRGSFTGAVADRPGLLLQAHRGTVFMDEVGEMSLRMQALLLRFLETGEVQAVGGGAAKKHADVRVIAATNRDLPASVDKREFREDLYYRLNVLHMRIPPLRERKADIPLIADYYLGLFAHQHARPKPLLSPAALEALTAHAWPGNIRELRNCIERTVLRATGDTIELGELPMALTAVAHPIDANGTEARGNDPLEPHRLRMQEIIDRLLTRHESFWTAVYQHYMLRDITRDDVRLIIKLGLERTRGSYRGLVTLFNMDARDYKRFMGFLKQHDCHVAFQPFREVRVRRDERPLFQQL
jgi:transcriptional regulator with PAS, ATPase and Fis domain